MIKNSEIMISEKEYKEAKRVVDNYNKQQLNIPLTMISLSDLREKYNKCYDEMIRCKKGKMMVWYYAEKKKLTELRNELNKRKTN